MSAFSRQDVEQSKGMLAQHIVNTLLVLWLLVSRSDVSDLRWILLLYFFLCWVYSILRVAQRMMAMRKASSVHGLVRTAKVVADYMEDIYASGDKIHDMATCKYLVLGDEKDSSPPSMAPYLTKVGSMGKIVTLDMIWNNEDKLLTRALKDACLSFALFKLLKRRFCSLPIAEKGDPEALEFVLAEGKDAFRLVEMELSFLYDFFYTKYPALFPASRALGVVRFVVLLGLFKVLLIDFAFQAYSYTSLYSDGVEVVSAEMLEFTTGYSNNKAIVFILFNNILVVFMILSIDILQGVATGYSNWAIVHYVCDYVRRTDEDGWWMTVKRRWNRGFGIRRALIRWVAARRARKPAYWWDNKLGQYSLLKSCGYTASKTNALSLLTLRMMEKTREGRKREKDVTLTDEIKTAVLSSLRESSGRLSVGRSRELRDHLLHLHWAPFDLPTSTHMVLVWHIATTICAETADQSTYNDKELLSLHVATTLSGYCAYLLAFVPDMLPDHSYKATQILDAVILDARERFGKIEALSDKCREMLQLKAPNMSDRVQDLSILILGADLATQLLLENENRQLSENENQQLLEKTPPRWDLLACFWADLVLFLAPSDKPDVHADCLATGGEFMTHLWALLTHAGIVDRPDMSATAHV